MVKRELYVCKGCAWTGERPDVCEVIKEVQAGTGMVVRGYGVFCPQCGANVQWMMVDQTPPSIKRAWRRWVTARWRAWNIKRTREWLRGGLLASLGTVKNAPKPDPRDKQSEFNKLIKGDNQ